jgi:hypothetical protein
LSSIDSTVGLRGISIVISCEHGGEEKKYSGVPGLEPRDDKDEDDAGEGTDERGDDEKAS